MILKTLSTSPESIYNVYWDHPIWFRKTGIRIFDIGEEVARAYVFAAKILIGSEVEFNFPEE